MFVDTYIEIWATKIEKIDDTKILIDDFVPIDFNLEILDVFESKKNETNS